ncbi:MAG: glutamate 5-kinase [Actinomycetota bacterium]|jgi:glutamate 5-kinase
MTREIFEKANRVVVKVGSSSISGENADQIDRLVEVLAQAHRSGREVVLVSSGAIATGMPLLQLEAKPEDLATSQALASVGQSRLIARYQTQLEKFGIIAGQVLLTADDLEGEETRANAARAMQRLLELRVLPIVNENDTTATAEIRFGDNDRLAALVAVLVDAEALVLLSDVDALYTAPPTDPDAKRIEEVDFEDDLAWVNIGGTSTGVGTGGAVTKVLAAKLANAEGIPVLLTSTSNVSQALNANEVGTLFNPAK